jgi:hypothetical protein
MVRARNQQIPVSAACQYINPSVHQTLGHVFFLKPFFCSALESMQPVSETYFAIPECLLVPKRRTSRLAHATPVYEACLSFKASRRNPEHSRCGKRIDGPSLPPSDFVSEVVVVAVMGSAKRYGELVAHLAPHCPRLGEPQMVGVRWASPADQTWLRCYEPEVGFIAKPTNFAERKLAFIDLGGNSMGLKIRRGRPGIIGDGRHRRDL